MDEEKINEKEETSKKKKTEEEPLPFCTTAPSAEQSRSDEDDEPCDDGRAGP